MNNQIDYTILADEILIYFITPNDTIVQCNIPVKWLDGSFDEDGTNRSFYSDEFPSSMLGYRIDNNRAFVNMCEGLGGYFVGINRHYAQPEIN